MKITVGLNTKSIKNAIKSLETAKKQLNDKMVEELLIACCERIKSLANENIATLDIGENVKSGIQGAWAVEKTDNGYKLTNTWHKAHGKFEMAAAYVEFGTGVVGGEADNSHPKATEVGWQYNMPSSSKDEDGVWGFYTNLADLDLPDGNYLIERRYGKSNDSRGRVVVSSQGAPATRFLYNAVMKFDSEKHAQALWQEIKAKYWG